VGELRKDDLNIKLARKLFYQTKHGIKEDSNNVKKIKAQLVLQHRKSFNNWLTNEIAKKYYIVCIEAMQTSNLVKSAKGDDEIVGTNVKAKSGLNREIANIGWYQIYTMLQYKIKENSGVLIEVPARNNSITCSVCGHVDAASRDKEDFCCTSCSHVDNADVNAAKVIERKGLVLYILKHDLCKLEDKIYETIFRGDLSWLFTVDTSDYTEFKKNLERKLDISVCEDTPISHNDDTLRKQNESHFYT
jgi:hypothetical protein